MADPFNRKNNATGAVVQSYSIEPNTHAAQMNIIGQSESLDMAGTAAFFAALDPNIVEINVTLNFEAFATFSKTDGTWVKTA